MDYIWLVIQSLDWSSIVLGLIIAGITAFFLWTKERRHAVAKWRKERKDHAYELRQLPVRIADIDSNMKALAEARNHTTTHLAAIKDQLTGHGDILENQNLMLADISAMSHGQMELDIVPRFVCDSSGSNRYVNTAYARLIGCGRDELAGFGYRRFYTHALNPEYYDDFMMASAQHRTFEAEAIITRTDGSHAVVKLRIVPHPEDVPPATHWNGVVVYVREHPDE